MFGSGTSAFGASTGAFSFGSSSTPAFGASASTPAFGSSTPAFGSSTPAFGSTLAFGSATPAFGASSSQAFSFPSSSPAFGAASTPAFGAASTPGFTSGFGFGAGSAASSDAFSFAPASTPATQSIFGQASAPAGGGFGQLAPFGQQHQQQQAPQQQQQLFTKNGQPITESTQWDDIHQDSQQSLLALEQMIVQCRHQQQQLNAGEHLQQGKQVKQDMEAHHQMLLHTLQVVGRVIKADSDSVHSFSERVAQLLRDTDTAVTTFTRTKLWRELAQSHAQGQPIETAKRDMVLRLPIVLPSHYLRIAVQQFQETLQQYQDLVQRLEAVVQSETEIDPALSKGAAGDEPPLQVILQNVYRYLMAVAANLDRLHEAVSDARQSFLAARQQENDFSDPFADADQIEQQKRKAEQAVHSRQAPLLPGSAPAAPPGQHQQSGPQAAPTSAPQLGFGQSAPASTPAGSLFGSQPAFGQQSAAAPGSLFGSSTPAFGAPQPAPATSSTFGTPGGGLFGTPQSTPSAPLFGTPQTPQASFGFGGQPQTAGAFGQTPTAFGAAATTFGKPAASTANKKGKGRR